MQQQETIHAVMAPLDDDSIRSRIMTIHGVQVMFDRDLADIYGVTTKRLNEQVKRNIDRFPPTFRFALSVDEMSELVANCDRFRTMKHSSVPMSAFTEHGIHISHTGRIEAAEIKGRKTRAVFEHTVHISDTGRMKAAEVDGRKASAPAEHTAHIGDIDCVEIGEIKGRKA